MEFPRELHTQLSRKQYLSAIPFSFLILMYHNKVFLTVVIGQFVYGCYSSWGEGWVSILSRQILLWLVAHVVLWIFIRFKFARLLRRNPGILGPRKVAMGSEGLRWTNGKAVRIQHWKDLGRPLRFLGFIYLRDDSHCAFIPTSTFEGRQQLEDWISAFNRCKAQAAQAGNGSASS